MKIRSVAICVILGLVGCAPEPERIAESDQLVDVSQGGLSGFPVSPCELYPSHGFQWSDGTWLTYAPQQFPLSVGIDSTFDPHMQDLIVGALEHWELQTSRDLFTVQILHPDAMADDPSAVQTGQVILNIHIKRGTLPAERLGFWEGVYFWTDGVPRMSWSTITLLDAYDSDIQAAYVILHEIGHALGLKHDAAQNSVMFEDTSYVSATGGLSKIQPEDILLVQSVIDGTCF